ncbi:MAG: MaoC family dehydratase N-terminal domain-containing protein, partial [Spirulina sp.]
MIDEIIDQFIKKSQQLTDRVIREREPWNTEATAQAIRHFAYGISDDNPLWLDRDRAIQNSYGCLVAPPTFLTSVLYPILHGYPMDIPMSNLIGELEYEWFYPILEGDSFTPSAKQTGVYESRDRQNRRLVCILSETSYWNQKEELVGKARSNLVWMARTENDFLVNRSIYEYSQEELANISTALQQENRRSDRVLWGEDVEINTQLPPLVRGPLTVGDLICWQAAIGASYRPGALGYRDGLKAPHAMVKNPITGWSVINSQHHEDFLLAKQRGMPAP